nr:MAG TPA: hypothetical protein [Caudoviricetes sp.]
MIFVKSERKYLNIRNDLFGNLFLEIVKKLSSFA